MNTYINKDNIEWLTISRTIIGIIAIVSIVVCFSKYLSIDVSLCLCWLLRLLKSVLTNLFVFVLD